MVQTDGNVCRRWMTTWCAESKLRELGRVVLAAARMWCWKEQLKKRGRIWPEGKRCALLLGAYGLGPNKEITLAAKETI